MATLAITRNYADGEVLLEADLDEICDDVEAFLNNEQLGDSNIADASITASDKLIDSSISTAKLAASAVTTAKIADDAVTAAKVADGAIDDAAKLASSVVTTAKIADDTITAAKLQSNSITTAKITDSNVTTAKIADGAVTPAKRSTALYAQAISSNGAAILTASGTSACSFTGTGRPVLLHFDFILLGGTLGVATADFAGTAQLSIYKNGTKLIGFVGVDSAVSDIPLTAHSYIDTSGYSGSVTYDLRNDNSQTITLDSGVAVRLIAMEL